MFNHPRGSRPRRQGRYFPAFAFMRNLSWLASKIDCMLLHPFRIISGLIVANFLFRADEVITRTDREDPSDAPLAPSGPTRSAESPLIQETCATIRELGIPIRDGDSVADEILPELPRFESRCRELLRDAQAYQRDLLKIGPRLWLAPSIFRIDQQLRGLGLVTLNGRVRAFFSASKRRVNDRYYQGGDLFWLTGGRVGIGLFAPQPDNLNIIDESVTHEGRHQWDQQAIIRADPMATPILNNETMPPTEIYKLFRIYLTQIANQVPLDERDDFVRYAEFVFLEPMKRVGPEQRTEIIAESYRLISEMLRYGEESLGIEILKRQAIHDPLPACYHVIGGVSAERLRTSLEHQREVKHPQYIERCLLLAEYELAGTAERFLARPDIHTMIPESMDRADIEFFKKGILASRKFLGVH